MMEKARVRIYACGGGATSIMSAGVANRPSEVMAADPVITYVNSSKSDITGRIDTKDTYLIKGLDGGGKKRSLNIDPIRAHVPTILTEHPPELFNIVVFTMGGSTGSVAGPLIISELMKQKKNVIALCIGSEQDGTDIQNTLDTYASLLKIQTARNRVLPYKMFLNSATLPNKDIDAQVTELTGVLLVLFSQQHTKLDTKDIEHWINFDLVTNYQPTLASLGYFIRADRVPTNLGEVYTYVALKDPVSDRFLEDNHASHKTILDIPFGNHFEGISSTATNENLPPMFFTLSSGDIEDVLKQLVDTSNEQKRQQQASNARAKGRFADILGTKENGTDDDDLVV